MLTLLVAVFAPTLLLVVAAQFWRKPDSLHDEFDVRLAWMAAVLVLFASVACISELLGALHLLSAPAITVFWFVCLGGAIARGVSDRTRIRRFAHATAAAVGRDRFGLAVLIVALGIVAACAFFSPPNNYDSLTYHEARVAYWIQQHSLADFATDNPRQIEFGPLNSLAFLHLHLLTGADRLDNLLQWSVLAALLLPGASWMMEQFGAGSRIRAVGLVTIATLPSVITEGASTQNDLLVAGFLVATAVFALRLLQKPDLRSAGLLGIAAGLAILTKGTALVFGFGLALWWLISARPWRSPAAIRLALLSALIVLVINAPHIGRNLELSGRPFGLTAEYNRVEHLSATTTLSNLLKDLSLHFATARPAINEKLEGLFRWTHEHLLGISTDEPGMNFGEFPFAINRSWRKEDFVGNLLALGWFGITLTTLAWHWVKSRRQLPPSSEHKRRASLAWFGVGVFAALITFCATLRWQPWGGRLMTPLFCLGCIWAAPNCPWLERRGFAVAAMAGLLVAAAPWLLKNETRPLLGERSVLTTPRSEQWFNASGPQALTAFQQLREALQSLHFSDIGLHTPFNFPEYPVLRLLRHQPAHPSFRHVGVTSFAHPLESGPPPGLVLSEPGAEELLLDGRRYVPIWKNAAYALFRPELERGMAATTPITAHLSHDGAGPTEAPRKLSRSQ